jgi:hypothetical protein
LIDPDLIFVALLCLDSSSFVSMARFLSFSFPSINLISLIFAPIVLPSSFTDRELHLDVAEEEDTVLRASLGSTWLLLTATESGGVWGDTDSGLCSSAFIGLSSQGDDDVVVGAEGGFFSDAL